MASNDVRCPDVCRRTDGKQNKHQFAEMAGNSSSNIGHYGRETKLRLPFTALTEEFKVTKARMAITIQTSSDDCVRKAGVTLPTGRKLAVQEAAKRGNIPFKT